MRITSVFGALAFLSLVALSGCQSEPGPPLLATHLEVSKPLPGMTMSVAYLSLTNNTDMTMTITKISSPQFGAIEMHESLLVDGIAKMRRIAELGISAGVTESFERGGKHLMLMRPADGAFDTKTSTTFNFYSGETLLLSVNASGGDR